MISSARSPGCRTKLATPTALSNDAAVTVTEASYEAVFQQPIIAKLELISSAQDVAKQMQKIYDRVYDKHDWEKRVDGLKLLRKCVQERVPQYYPDAFFTGLNNMSLELQACLDCAQFSVMREACMTIAFIARETKMLKESASAKDVSRFACIASQILPVLIRVSSKNTRCMSSCAAVAVTYIIESTKTPKLVRLFCAPLPDRAARKSCYLFIVRMLEVWDLADIGNEKNVSLLANFILAGLNDADADIRDVAGKSVVEFNRLFPKETESLVLANVIDKQKVESLIKFSVHGTLRAVPVLNAYHQVSAAIDAKHAKNEVRDISEGRPTAAVAPKPYFSTGLSITVPKAAAGGRPPSAFEQLGSSSGGDGDGDGKNVHAADSDAALLVCK